MTSKKSRALDVINNFEMQFIRGRTARGGGSKSIMPIVEPFFDTCRRVVQCIHEEDWQVMKNVTSIAEAGLYAGLNTFCNQDLSNKDYRFIKGIFAELEALLDEFLVNARPLTVRIVDGKLEHVRPEGPYTNWEEKISMISRVLHDNQMEVRNPVGTTSNARCENVMWSYEELLQVVHRLNSEWDALCRSGLSSELYSAYLESKGYNPEASAFMGILEGKCKLIPVYKYAKVAYVVVDKELSDIARIEHGKRVRAYALVDRD